MGEPRSLTGSPIDSAQHALRDVDVRGWARRFGLLADPNRLEILLCLHRWPGISVGELATATGRSENAISQALRLLRHEGCVEATRVGRSVTYRLTDPVIHEALHAIGARHP